MNYNIRKAIFVIKEVLTKALVALNANINEAIKKFEALNNVPVQEPETITPAPIQPADVPAPEAPKAYTSNETTTMIFTPVQEPEEEKTHSGIQY